MIERQFLFAQSIGQVSFDIAIDETHTSALAISTHPIEDGAPLVDHTYPQPDTVALNLAHGLIPLNLRNQQGEEMRLLDFYARLKTMQRNAEQFELVTGIQTYSNMLIQNMVVVRNRANATNMTVALLLREVEIRTTEEINDFNRRFSDAVAVSRRASTTQPRGTVTPTEIAPGTSESDINKSWLKSITGG